MTDDTLAVLARVLMRTLPAFPVGLSATYAMNHPGPLSALILAGSAVGYASTFALANLWGRESRGGAYRPSVGEVLHLWRDYERHVAAKDAGRPDPNA